MRRIMLSLVGAVAAIGLLVGMKTPLLGAPVDVAAGAPLDPAAPGSGAAPGGAPGGAPADPGQTAGPRAPLTPGAPGAPVPGQSTKPGQPPAPGQTTTRPAGGGTTTAPPPPPPPSTTVTGAAYSVPNANSPLNTGRTCGDCANYSIVVTLTIVNGKVTNATMSYSGSPGDSASFAQRAQKQLSVAIVGTAKWNLGKVTRATYAGNAWEMSARDALAKAGLPV